MAFVRAKRNFGVHGYCDFFYLVENRRAGGRVRQVVLAYLGTERTVDEAWYMAEVDIARTVQRLERSGWRASDQELAAYLAGGGELPSGGTPEQDRLLRKLGRLRARVESYRRYGTSPRMPERERRWWEERAAIQARRAAEEAGRPPDAG